MKILENQNGDLMSASHADKSYRWNWDQVMSFQFKKMTKLRAEKIKNWTKAKCGLNQNTKYKTKNKKIWILNLKLKSR